MCMALAITSALAAPTPTPATTTKNTALSDVSSTLSSTTKAPALSLFNGPASNSRLRKRHSKRHSKEGHHSSFNEDSTALEWENPCGGYFDPKANGTQEKKKQKKIYHNLRLATIKQLRDLNDSKHNYIDIDNFQMWGLHEPTYKFLPKLKQNATIPLKRWYRNMQTYVGSIAELLRTQLNWDKSKQSDGKISAELETLFVTSRTMLCELETAFNRTHPIKTPRLPQVSRAQMNKKLKLRTRIYAQQKPFEQREADAIDLKFVKYYYYKFLRTMRTVLRHYTKRLGQKKLKTNLKEYNEVDKQHHEVVDNIKKRRKQLRNHHQRNT